MAALTDGFHLFLDQFSSIVNFMMAICYREQGLDQLQLYEDEVSLDREKLENIFPCNAAISPLLAIIIDAYCIHRCKDAASIESSTECSTALPDALLITLHSVSEMERLRTGPTHMHSSFTGQSVLAALHMKQNKKRKHEPSEVCTVCCFCPH